MEYIYSALVLHAAGKEITDNSIEAILGAAGVAVEPSRVKALTASLEGVDIEEAIASAALVSASPAAAAAAPTAEAAPAADEEEEEEEEVSEEEAAAGLSALFG